MDLIGNRARADKRRPVLAVAAVVAAVAIAACGGGSSTATSGGTAASASTSTTASYTLNVGFIGTTGTLTGPEGFAYSNGLLQKWLAADGITNINVAQFANGPLLTAAMIGGSLDIGIVGDTPALIANSHGLPAKLINQDEVGLPAWIVGRRGVTSLSELAGQTVTRPQGSYMDRYLQGVLANDGLTGKVHLTAMLLPEGVPAVESGALAAIALPAWDAAPIVGQGGNVLAKSVTTPDIEGTGVTIATNKVLAAHPNVAMIWDGVRLKAIAYANANANAFYAFEAKSEGIKSATAAQQFLPLGVYPDANYTSGGLTTLQKTLDFLTSENEASGFSIDGWKAAGT
ncbi:MAG TPA: hypothetical protein VHX88_20045 [Solirubrobacteraceae bacterium]|jgi:NitT/TauT family transport system substrate-binding protein/sulfonate transport system substrate-binding protein|nr:hypothetical protein [Solirubrobacteraceae bacterium]